MIISGVGGRTGESLVRQEDAAQPYDRARAIWSLVVEFGLAESTLHLKPRSWKCKKARVSRVALS